MCPYPEAARMTPSPPCHTWIEIDAGALRHNLQLFRGRVPRTTRLCFVVKANAYGHGQPEVVRALPPGLVDWFAVHSLPEALQLRRHTQAPILVMGYVPWDLVDQAMVPGVRYTVWDPQTVRVLAARAEARCLKVPVHVKVETGTHRHGAHPRDALELARLISTFPSLVLEGLSTHYANIEDTTDYSYASHQTSVFFEVRRAFADAGFCPPVVHAACSAAALLFPPTHLDMVRIGIAGYGLWPSRETLVSASALPNFASLRPVLSWRAKLSQVKLVPAGAYVGYGLTYRTTRTTVLGVVPVGYAEGYPRALSGVGHVLVKGMRAPVRGRVCMNIFMVDVTDIPNVRQEDLVTLIGRDGDEEVSASTLAAQSGTIAYEIVSRLDRSIPRLVVGGDHGAS